MVRRSFASLVAAIALLVAALPVADFDVGPPTVEMVAYDAIVSTPSAYTNPNVINIAYTTEHTARDPIPVDASDQKRLCETAHGFIRYQYGERLLTFNEHLRRSNRLIVA